MNNIELVKVGPADATTLLELARQTFTDTFGAVNSTENMQAYVNEAFTENKLLAELNNPSSLFYFANVNGKPAGYLKLNFGAAQTDLKDEPGLEIERIYVLQAFHGQKVGQALIDYAIAVAAAHGAAYIWLGVWELNPRAIRFYEKNGFAPFGTHVFQLGNDAQTDVLMKRLMPPRTPPPTH